MKDGDKTKKQLLDEIAQLRERIAELEALLNKQILANKELEKSLNHFRNLFDNAIIGMYRTTPDGRILMANPAMVKMLGFSSFEEMAKRNLNEEGFYHDFPRSTFQQIIECEGEVIGMEARWIRADKTTLYVREHARAVRDEKGNILYYEGTVEDITERKRAEEELRRLATTDTLTNLFNRGTGLTLLEEQLKMADRENSKLTVCYIDVDDFKEINDNYGHLEGDAVLKLVAELLKKTTRDADIACRLGGDEFLLIFPNCTLNQAEALWRRIAKKVNALNAKRKKPYIISLSHGFAEYDPSKKITMDELLQIADREMYKDKYFRDSINRQ